MTTKTPTASTNRLQETQRVEWLDGIRGAAAMFVVLHHMWLAVWPHFPRNAGPWWLEPLLYGHLAVAVFIIVSGFSLALAPMRHGGRLNGGTRRFLRRRAWRILPPYWMALILSTIITAYILQPSLATPAVAKGFVVHGLLLQDVVGSFRPNGAFWSIAVEWQIYFVFPLILWVGLKKGMGLAVTCTIALVLVAHEAASLGGTVSKINHLTLQFLALFGLGVLAVYLGRGDHAAKLRRPVGMIGLVVLGSLLVLALFEGPVWMVSRYFWVDLFFGAGVACLIFVMCSGGGRRTRSLLSSRGARRLGLFSYSIYLLHGPVVGLLDQDVIGPLHLAPLAAFALFLGLGIPVILLLCYGFHLAFEAPFMRHRDLSALRSMPIVARLSPGRKVSVPPSAATPAEVVTARE